MGSGHTDRVKAWAPVASILAGSVALGAFIGWRWLSKAIDRAMEFSQL